MRLMNCRSLNGFILQMGRVNILESNDKCLAISAAQVSLPQSKANLSPKWYLVG